MCSCPTPTPRSGPPGIAQVSPACAPPLSRRPPLPLQGRPGRRLAPRQTNARQEPLYPTPLAPHSSLAPSPIAPPSLPSRPPLPPSPFPLSSPLPLPLVPGGQPRKPGKSPPFARPPPPPRPPPHSPATPSRSHRSPPYARPMSGTPPASTRSDGRRGAAAPSPDPPSG